MGILSQHIRHFRSARTLLLAVAIAGALLGFLFASQHASAYGTNYCVGWQPSGGECGGPTHTLTANIVYDDTGSGAYVCEIAVDQYGNGYGGWACGGGMTETCYPGSKLLRGLIYNASPYWLYMNGTEFYGQGCP
jgi:hypothetical protein